MKRKNKYKIKEIYLASTAPKNRLPVLMEDIGRDWGLCSSPRRATFLGRLTRGQRAFLFVLNLGGCIESDGFYLYLWNLGEEAGYALESLRVIGANKYIPILQAALSMFKNLPALRNRKLRQRNLMNHGEAEVNERFQRPFELLNGNSETNLQTHMLRYLSTHGDEFFLTRQEEAEDEAGKAAPGKYRASRRKIIKLRGERLHLALIERIWEPYWKASLGKNKPNTPSLASFIVSLTSGQRALMALKVLDNMVRLEGWEVVVSNNAFELETLYLEFRAAWDLVGAKPYADLFDRTVKLAKARRVEIDAVRHAIEEIAKKHVRFGVPLSPGESAEFWRLHELEQQLKSDLSAEEKIWREEYLSLGETPATKLATFIEPYVNAHPDEFFYD